MYLEDVLRRCIKKLYLEDVSKDISRDVPGDTIFFTNQEIIKDKQHHKNPKALDQCLSIGRLCV